MKIVLNFWVKDIQKEMEKTYGYGEPMSSYEVDIVERTIRIFLSRFLTSLVKKD